MDIAKIDPLAINRNSVWFRKLPIEERVRLSYVETPTGCWRWLGSTRPRGYGQLKWKGVPRQAHRAVYELLVGDLAAGITIDHLCGVKLCVNPAHMEPVTVDENHRRWARSIASCKRGHPFSVENTYRTPQGGRRCRTCRKLGRVTSVAAPRRYRPSHCPAGHAYDETNTYVSKAGSRMCRTCCRERTRSRRAASALKSADGGLSDDPPERGAA